MDVRSYSRKVADDLVRERDVRPGQALAQQLADPALVLGMAIGVQQHDGDRLGLARRHLLGERARGVLVERAQRPVGAHALGRPEAQLGRDERRGVRGAQPVEVGARLAAQLDHVGEARGGDQRGARAAALEQGVRGDGHPVREDLHLARVTARERQRGIDRAHHALGLVVRRRGHLRGDDPPVDRERRVGERPADVDAQQHGARLRDTGRAMADEDIAVVRRAIDAISRRDLEAVFAEFDEDLVLDWTASRSIDAGIYHGLDGLREFLLGYWETFDEMVLTPEELLERGDVVVAAMLSRFTRVDGIAIDTRFALTATMRDRRIAHLRMDQGLAEALEALESA